MRVSAIRRWTALETLYWQGKARALGVSCIEKIVKPQAELSSNHRTIPCDASRSSPLSVTGP